MQIFCVESNRVIGRLVDAVHTVRSCYSNLFQRFYVGFYNDVEFGSFSVGYLHGLFDGFISECRNDQRVFPGRGFYVIESVFVGSASAGRTFQVYSGKIHDLTVGSNDSSRNDPFIFGKNGN